MENGSNRKDFDFWVRQDFLAKRKEIHSSESARDWFASSKLMEASLPAPNIIYYDNEHVRPQALELGLCSQTKREHMFDKVVTPSDVGKLNRLVIPKQYAEKYFPLDSASNEKGLILNFEDLTGKPWRFRYSYWNSSQSYVMTKGWSRFVKEKKLDAGDIVSFQRGVGEGEKHHLFIDWRRRQITSTTLPFHTQFYRPSWSPLMLRPQPLTRIHPSNNFQFPNNRSSQYNFSNGCNIDGNYMGQVVTNNASVVYLTSPEMIGTVRGRAGGVGRERIPVVFESVPVIKGKKVVIAAAAKRMRLFGVNMECPISSDTSTSDDHFETLFSSSSAIPVVPTDHLINQYPSQSTSFLTSSMKMYNGTPILDKGETSMSLNLDI